MKEDLEKLKVSELHKMASKMKISSYKSFKKAELIDKILKEMKVNEKPLEVKKVEVGRKKTRRRSSMTWK